MFKKKDFSYKQVFENVELKLHLKYHNPNTRVASKIKLFFLQYPSCFEMLICKALLALFLDLIYLLLTLLSCVS